MNIHEYQAKAVLREFGVPVPRGIPAFSVEEAVKAANELGGPVWVVKAQIHAGGRGKAGGVKVVKSIDDVKKRGRSASSARRWSRIRPGRTARKCNRLYIEEGSAIDARVLSLRAGRPRDLARRLRRFDRRRHGHRGSGAHDAGENPHRSRSIRRPASCRITAAGRAARSGLTGELAKQAESMLPKLYAAFVAKDMSLLEINPLVVTKSGELICLDAKIGFDDNALYRHPDIAALRDVRRGRRRRRSRPSKYDLNYIALDGTIGCMVNGAGLAMATMDIIKLYGDGAGEFPRRRRRRHQGQGGGRVQDHHSRPQCEGHPGQHLRRHHAMRRDRRGRGRRGEGGRPARAAGRAARRHQCRSRQGDHRQIGSATIIAADDLDDAAQKIVNAVKEAALMAILVDKNTKVICQGFTGKNGTFHSEQAIAYGTKMVGGVSPGKGGTTHLDLPVFDTVAEARAEDRRRRQRDLCAAALRRRRDLRGDRRRDPADRLHHRGHSGARHGARSSARCRGSKSRLIGPNCPGVMTAGECKIGIMPGQHLQAAARSASSRAPAR